MSAIRISASAVSNTLGASVLGVSRTSALSPADSSLSVRFRYIGICVWSAKATSSTTSAFIQRMMESSRQMDTEPLTPLSSLAVTTTEPNEPPSSTTHSDRMR